MTPEQELERAKELLNAAYHALKSYEFGNASPELARECARAIAERFPDAAIPK